MILGPRLHAPMERLWMESGTSGMIRTLNAVSQKVTSSKQEVGPRRSRPTDIRSSFTIRFLVRLARSASQSQQTSCECPALAGLPQFDMRIPAAIAGALPPPPKLSWLLSSNFRMCRIPHLQIHLQQCADPRASVTLTQGGSFRNFP